MLNRFSRWGMLLVATLMLGLLLAACGDSTATPATSGDTNQSQPKDKPQAPTGYTSAMAGSFPASTSVYITLNTNTSSDQIKGWQNIVKYISQIPEAKTVFQNADVLALSKLGTYDSDIQPWLGNEVAIGVTDVNAVVNLATGGGAAPGEIPVLLGASVKDQAKAEAFITKITGQLKQAGLPDAKMETYKEAKLWTINVSFFNAVVGLSKDKLFIGGGPNLVKAALDQTALTSLSTKDTYKGVTAKLQTSNLAFVYADYQAIVKTLIDNPQLKTTMSSLKSTNLDYTGGVGVTFGTVDEGFRIDAVQTYVPEKTPPAVAEMLKKGVNPNKILSALPESAFFFANSRDAVSAYDNLINTLKSAGSGAAQVDKSIKDFETQSKLSLKGDIVSLFEGEFAAFAMANPANKTIPVSGGIIADASDKAATQAKLDKIVAAAETAGGGAFKFEDKTSGSTKYKAYTVKGEASTGDISINLGIAGNYVFLTLGGDPTEVIASATGGKNFTKGANSDTFNKVKAALPDKNQGYAYIDLQASIKLAQTLVPAEMQSQVKNYTDKLTKLMAIAATGTQSATETISTILIYFPVTK